MDCSLRIRIFDKEFKRYIDPEEIDYYIDSNGRVILEIERITENGVFELKEFDITEADDSYRIERCTGLRDKNGKLVYEGDVLHQTVSGLACRIVFYRGAFCGKFDNGFTSPLPGWFRPDSDEVIGNIHEGEK